MTATTTKSDVNPTPAPAPTPPSGPTERPDRFKSILSFTQGLVPLVVAVIVLIAFATVLKEMLTRADTDITPETWGRYTYLFRSLEALAYAAAGFLFGREVNRQRAENAEANADKSQEIAFEAQGVAAVSEANGKALATGVRALHDFHDSGQMHPELDSGTGAEAAPISVEMLRSMADEMFPSVPRR